MKGMINMETGVTFKGNKPDENKSFEKDTEKVKNKYNFTKSKQKQSAKKTKKCKVVSYIKHKNFIIISFDGVGIRFDDIKEYPGDEVTVEYTGSIGKPDFRIEMK